MLFRVRRCDQGSTMDTYQSTSVMNISAFGNIIPELHNHSEPSKHMPINTDSLQIKRYGSIQWHGFGVTEMTIGFASFSVNWRLCLQPKKWHKHNETGRHTSAGMQLQVLLFMQQGFLHVRGWYDRIKDCNNLYHTAKINRKSYTCMFQWLLV